MLNIYILFIYYFNQLSAVLSFFYLCKMHSKYLYDLIENSSLPTFLKNLSFFMCVDTSKFELFFYFWLLYEYIFFYLLWIFYIYYLYRIISLKCQDINICFFKNILKGFYSYKKYKLFKRIIYSMINCFFNGEVKIFEIKYS